MPGYRAQPGFYMEIEIHSYHEIALRMLKHEIGKETYFYSWMPYGLIKYL